MGWKKRPAGASIADDASPSNPWYITEESTVRGDTAVIRVSLGSCSGAVAVGISGSYAEKVEDWSHVRNRCAFAG